MIISPCPKCGSLKCAMRLYKFESHPKCDARLDGEWPCEWSVEKTVALERIWKERWKTSEQATTKEAMEKAGLFSPG